MPAMSLVFGAVVGLSLGLTGGGGAIFAVPLLVYGLGMPPRDAVGVSLAAVGATSLVGFVHRWMLRQVELPAGLLFAVAGMLGAPIGTWIGGALAEALLLTLFGAFMIVIALRMWRQTARPAHIAAECAAPGGVFTPTCQRDSAGRLMLTSRCAILLLCVGLGSGVLSGLFGVGGGFIIVPALVLFSRMPIHHAVGTSLMVISLVSVSGVTAQLLAGRTIPAGVTALFVLGGIAGLFGGHQIGRRLSGPALQRLFSVAILAVAVFVIARNLVA